MKKFIQEYPTLKDRSGFGGTTLLYAAALNNQLEVVKYLVEKGHCATDATNWPDIHKNQLTTNADTRSPTAGSTALHGACLQGHLRIVEYLVREKHANYLAENDAKKTPIAYGEQHSDVRKFFKEYLNSDDGTNESSIWEYKPLLTSDWHRFTNDQAQLLHETLSSKDDFQIEIQLQTNQGSTNISMATFLQSDQQKKAWIRCRSSSIQHFNIESIWQLMFTKCPKATNPNNDSLLTAADLTTISHIELNKWYTCDERLNLHLNNSMDIHRKLVQIDIPRDMDNDESVQCDLQSFTFANDDKTIVGFVRWIPKLISKDLHGKNKIHEVDNFNIKPNVKPFPQNIEHLSDGSTSSEDEFRVDDDDDDSDASQDKTTTTKKKVCWIVT